MDLSELRSFVEQHPSQLRKELGVQSLSVFGSVANGTAGENSDIDLVVDFEGPAGFDAYLDLKFFLEDHLDHKIDLVTRKALRPEIRDHILEEMIRVA